MTKIKSTILPNFFFLLAVAVVPLVFMLMVAVSQEEELISLLVK